MIQSLDELLNPRLEGLPDVVQPVQAPQEPSIPVSNPYQDAQKQITDYPAAVADDYFSKPNTEGEFQPYKFDWDESGVEKFTKLKDYNLLGADPRQGDDVNAERYANMFTWDQSLKRGVGGFGAQFIDHFADQVKSWGNLVNALSDPSLKSAFQQEQLDEINKKNQEFQNNWYIPTSPISPNKWSSFMQNFQNAGGLLGTVAEIAGETFVGDAAIAKTFGALSKVEDLQKLKSISDATKDAEKLSNIVTPPNMVDKVFNYTGQLASKVSPVLPGIGNTTRFLGDLSQYGAEGGAAATVGRGLGALVHDIRGVNLAVSFASSNAAATYQSLYNQQKQDYVKNNGTQPDEATDQSFKSTALKAAKTDGAINAWTMLFMEKLAFGNILRGSGTLQQALEAQGKDIYSKVGIVPEMFQKEGESPVFLKQNKWLDFKSDYFALPIKMAEVGAGFGLQMTAMDVIDKTVKSYYQAKFDHKDIEFSDALKDSLNKEFSLDGAGTFISGFINGSLLLGLGGHLLGKTIESIDRKRSSAEDLSEYAKSTGKAQDFVNKVNNIWNDPISPIKQNIHDTVLQSAFTKQTENSIQNGDTKGFHDTKDDSTREWILSATRNGVLDLYLDRLKDYQTKFKPEDLTAAFGIPYTEENHQSLLNELTNLQGRAKDIKRIYREVQGKFGSPFNPYKYEEGTPEYLREVFRNETLQHAIDYAVFTKDNVERAVERQNEILNGKNGSTGIKDMPFTKDIDFSTLYSITNSKLMEGEIETAREELKAMQSGVGDAKQVREVQDRIKYLEDYQKKLEKYTTDYQKILEKGAHENRQDDINKLDENHKESLVDSLHVLLNHNAISNNKNEVFKNNVRDGIDKFLDYYKLGVEHNKSLTQANIILDPGVMNKYFGFFKKYAANIKEAAKKSKETSTPSKPTESKEKPSPFKTAEEIPFEDVEKTQKPVEVNLQDLDKLLKYGVGQVQVDSHKFDINISDTDKHIATVTPIEIKSGTKLPDLVNSFVKLGNELASKGIGINQPKITGTTEQLLWNKLIEDGYAKRGIDGVNKFLGDIERTETENLSNTITPEEKNIEDKWDATRAVESSIFTESPYKETAGYIPGNLHSTTGQSHDIIGGKDIETKIPDQQRWFRNSTNMVLPQNSSNYLQISHAETNNDPYGIVYTKQAHDIKLVLANDEGKPIDKNGKVIDNPNKDNIIYTSMPVKYKGINLLGGNLNDDKDPEIDKILDRITEKQRLTPVEKELFKNDLINQRRLIASIREGKIKRLEVIGKGQGTPVLTELQTKVDETGKQYQAVQKNNLEGVLLKKDFDPLQPKHPNGNKISIFVNGQGKIDARTEDGLEWNKIYNRELLEKEQDNVIKALKYLSTIDAKHPDYPKLQNLLKSTIFFGKPKVDNEGKEKYAGVNRLFIKEDTNGGKGLYKTEFTYDNSKKILDNNGIPILNQKRICTFVPSEIEKHKEEIVGNAFHQINDIMLKSNEPYVQRIVTEDKGNYSIENKKNWKNYLEYLVKNEVPVIHTNIIPYDTEGVAQMKNVNLTYQGEQLSLDQVKPKEQKTESKKEQQNSQVNTYGSFTYPENYKYNVTLKNITNEDITEMEKKLTPEKFYKFLSENYNFNLGSPLNKDATLYKLEENVEGNNVIYIMREDINGNVSIIDARSEVKPETIPSPIETREVIPAIVKVSSTISDPEKTPANNIEDIPFDLSKSLEKTDSNYTGQVDPDIDIDLNSLEGQEDC